MKYPSPYQKEVGAFGYAQNSIMKAIKSTIIQQDDISNLKRDLDYNNQNGNYQSSQSKLHFNHYDNNNTNDDFFRSNNNDYKRVNPRLDPIKEHESSVSESKMKTYTNVRTNFNQSPPNKQEEEEDYNAKPGLMSLTDNHSKRLMASLNSFKSKKMLVYNNIDIKTLQTAEITVPFLTLVLFILSMVLRGKHRTKSLYLFLVLFPILNWFLINQLMFSLLKFKSHMKKNIPLINSITFFYSAFIPTAFSSWCLLILRKRAFVGLLCLLCGITYSALLNEKYHGVYFRFDINQNNILLMINLILYAFFILVIV